MNVFQITGWDEQSTFEGENGQKQTVAKVTQLYQGVIEGSSNINYVMSYQDKSNAMFVGFERVVGSYAGQSGSFVLQHQGKFENGVASSSFTVVENSGTDGLAGLSGTGSFQSGEAGKAEYLVEFELSKLYLLNTNKK